MYLIQSQKRGLFFFIASLLGKRPQGRQKTKILAPKVVEGTAIFTNQMFYKTDITEYFGVAEPQFHFRLSEMLAHFDPEYSIILKLGKGNIFARILS